MHLREGPVHPELMVRQGARVLCIFVPPRSSAPEHLSHAVGEIFVEPVQLCPAEHERREPGSGSREDHRVEHSPLVVVRRARCPEVLQPRPSCFRRFEPSRELIGVPPERAQMRAQVPCVQLDGGAETSAGALPHCPASREHLKNQLVLVLAVPLWGDRLRQQLRGEASPTCYLRRSAQWR